MSRAVYLWSVTGQTPEISDMASLTQAAMTVVSTYLRFGRTSSLLVTSVSALSFLFLIHLRKKMKRPTLSEKERSEHEMTQFLMSSEKVIKMIQDASFLSDIDVTLMCGADDMAPDDMMTPSDVLSSDRDDITLRCEHHEESWAGLGAETGQVARHHQELWRLTSDISCHQVTSDLSHHEMSGLQWQYTDKGRWDEAWSDYGSLESDQEESLSDDLRMIGDPLDWDVSRISLAEDGVL